MVARHNPGRLDQPWTQARCQRLLRSFRSRLNALKRRCIQERAKVNPRAVRGTSGCIHSDRVSSIPIRCADQGGLIAQAGQAVADRGYHSALRTKRLRLETPRPRHHELVVDEIDVPTPYLNLSLVSIEDDTRHEVKARNNARFTTRAVQYHRPAMEELVSESFQELLSKTSRIEETSKSLTRRGARSLLEMCARRTPVLMEQEQALSQTAGDGEPDVVAETYQWLQETFEVASGAGWPYLRVVVRAHGILLFHAALRDNYLQVESVTTATLLGQSATSARASNFAEERREFIEALYPHGVATMVSDERHLVLAESYNSILRRVAVQLTSFKELEAYSSGRSPPFTLVLRLIGFTISDGSYPLQWLPVELHKPFWETAIRAFSGSESLLVTGFLQMFLSRACGVPAVLVTDATCTAVRSLCTILTSITIIFVGSEEPCSRSARALRSVATEIDMSWQSLSSASSFTFSGIVQFVLAGDLLTALFDVRIADEDAAQLAIWRLAQLSKLVSISDLCGTTELVSFMQSVAKCCARGLKQRNESHHTIHQIMQKLILLSSRCNTEVSSFAMRLALMLGEQSEMSKAAPNIIGYRWEQGIDEWIAATPAVLRKSPPVDNVISLRTPPLPALPVIVNGRTTYPTTYTPSDLSSDVSDKTPISLSNTMPLSTELLSTANEEATPAMSRVCLDNLNRPSGCLESPDPLHYGVQRAYQRTTARASASRNMQTRLRSSSTSTSIAQGKKRRRLEDKENRVPDVNMNNIEEEDDELSIIETPMMRVGSARRKNLRPRITLMMDDRTDEFVDELG